MADWCNPGIDRLTTEEKMPNRGKYIQAAKAAIISDYGIEVKWLADWLTDGSLVLTDWLTEENIFRLPKLLLFQIIVLK